VRHRLVGLSLACAAALSAGRGEAGGSPRPDAKALVFFADARPASLEDFLHSRRPPPLASALREQILANLPAEGELRPSPAEQRKLASLDRVLRLYGRVGVVVKVIEVGHAFVGLHARTVLLLSRDALGLVTPEELQALAAHELAHEYSWDEYQAAMRLRDHERMQEMELMCDGFAVVALRALDIDAAHLVNAVTKVTRFNERIGATGTARSYVSLESRRRFIHAVDKAVGTWTLTTAEDRAPFEEALRQQGPDAHGRASGQRGSNER
jgi:hypothetical protein